MKMSKYDVFTCVVCTVGFVAMKIIEISLKAAAEDEVAKYNELNKDIFEG